MACRSTSTPLIIASAIDPCVIALAAMRCHYPGMTTAATYAEFAARETHGVSPTYERLSVAVSRDDEILSPAQYASARQAAAEPAVRRHTFPRWPGRGPGRISRLHGENWPAIGAEMRTRATQTNEAGRCAILLPVLAALPQPLALLDVGAPAGLCLYPDQVPPPRREAFAKVVRELPGHWISNEDADVLT